MQPNGNPAERIFFLYGSETGNSESIAKRLHHLASRNEGYPQSECMTLNQAVTKKLLEAQQMEDANPTCFVIVCSTTGEGEPPENASRFRRALRNLKEPLHNLRYTVLALGDTNYNNFCEAGKYLDTKLCEHGGTRFYPRGEADDGVALELVVDPWSDGLWAAMKSAPGATVGFGHESYRADCSPVDMAVAQETAVIYANSSQACSAMALFMFERIVELGGKATLYPMQFFSPTRLAHPPNIVLFILTTNCDERTLCECCATALLRPSPLGPFAELFQTHPRPDLPNDALALQSWMAEAPLRFYNTLCLSFREGMLPHAVALNEAVSEVCRNSKLELLCKAQGDGDVSTVATTEDDLICWAHSVLDRLPGVTADSNAIRQSIRWFFTCRVSAALRDEVRGAAPDVNKSKRVDQSDSTHHGQPCESHYCLTSSVTVNDDGLGPSTATYPGVLDDMLMPLVFLYTGNSSFIAQIADSLFTEARKRQFRCTLVDLSNFRQTGFPRHGTFVFIVAGLVTKSMSKALKHLQAIQAEGRTIEGVRFALLGMDDCRRSQKFNVYTLEMESLLLELRAQKIHCTGLVDIDRFDGSMSVIRTWATNLWCAIMHPSTSAAYLDMACPYVRTLSGYDASGGSAPGVTGRPVLSYDNEEVEGALVMPEHPSEPASSFRFGAGEALAPDDSHNGAAAMCAATSVPPPSGKMGPIFQWDLIPPNPRTAPDTPIVFLYSSGMSKTMAMAAKAEADALHFPTRLYSFSNFDKVDFTANPNVLLFCESGPKGQSSYGRRFMEYLLQRSHAPDHFFSVRFAVLGLGPCPSGVVHPAFVWASLFSRLQANRVFPVLVMDSLSQVHSHGMPWCKCVLGVMSVIASSFPQAGHREVRTREMLGNPDEVERKVLFLYGSSTGTAEAIARDLHQESLQRGFPSYLGAMKDFKKLQMSSRDALVVICSTVHNNQGGCPDNARRFMRYIHQKDHPKGFFSGISYAVLGLDDASLHPETFCTAAVDIDARLAELGAARLHTLAMVNSNCSIAHPVEEWRTSLFSVLEGTWVGKRKASDVSFSNVEGARSLTPSVTRGVGVDLSCLRLIYAPSSCVYLQTAAQQLFQRIEAATDFRVTVCTVGDLADFEWCNRSQTLVFLLSSVDKSMELSCVSLFDPLRCQEPCTRDPLCLTNYTMLSISGAGGTGANEGKILDQLLKELGAKCFYSISEIAEDETMECAIAEWTSGLLSTLSYLPDTCEADPRVVPASDNCPFTLSTNSWLSPSDAVTSICMESSIALPGSNTGGGVFVDSVLHSWKYHTSSSAEYPVIQMNLSVKQGTEWSPGQTVGIMPTNPTDTVEFLLKRLGVSSGEPFHPVSAVGAEASIFPTSPIYDHLRFPVSCGEVLQRYLSLRLTIMHRAFFQCLLNSTDNMADQEVIQHMIDDLNSRRPVQELMDVLEQIPHLELPFRHVVEHLSPLQPRVYSISSSRSMTPTCLSICFKVLHRGLCTNWLYEQCQWVCPSASKDSNRHTAGELFLAKRSCTIHFVIRPVGSFRMPLDPLVPLILVGAGTGIAPIMSFLQEREALLQRRQKSASQGITGCAGSDRGGIIDLYFGCRTRSHDFLYREDLEAYQRSGVLSSCNVTFSRENNGSFWYGGCYVQDRLQECGVSICELLSCCNAHVYVCGDADGMGKEVQRTIWGLLQQHLGLSDLATTDYVDKLVKEGRYLQESALNSFTMAVAVCTETVTAMLWPPGADPPLHSDGHFLHARFHSKGLRCTCLAFHPVHQTQAVVGTSQGLVYGISLLENKLFLVADSQDIIRAVAFCGPAASPQVACISGRGEVIVVAWNTNRVMQRSVTGSHKRPITHAQCNSGQLGDVLLLMSADQLSVWRFNGEDEKSPWQCVGRTAPSQCLNLREGNNLASSSSSLQRDGPGLEPHRFLSVHVGTDGGVLTTETNCIVSRWVLQREACTSAACELHLAHRVAAASFRVGCAAASPTYLALGSCDEAAIAFVSAKDLCGLATVTFPRTGTRVHRLTVMSNTLLACQLRDATVIVVRTSEDYHAVFQMAPPGPAKRTSGVAGVWSFQASGTSFGAFWTGREVYFTHLPTAREWYCDRVKLGLWPNDLLQETDLVTSASSPVVTAVPFLRTRNRPPSKSVSPCSTLLTKSMHMRYGLPRSSLMLPKKPHSPTWVDVNVTLGSDRYFRNKNGGMSAVVKALYADKLDATSRKYNMDKLREFIVQFGVFPAKYRSAIWRFLLELPDKRQTAPQYAALARQPPHIAVGPLMKPFPVADATDKARVESVVSALAWHAPVFTMASFLPAHVFPFVKVFGDDTQSVVEVFLSFLNNWGFECFACYPQYPPTLFTWLEKLLKREDSLLQEHLETIGASVDLWGWDVWLGLYTDLLTGPEWLQMMDHAFLMHPIWLYLFHLRYLIAMRETLLQCRSESEVLEALRRPQRLQLSSVILHTHTWYCRYTKESDAPSRLLQFHQFGPSYAYPNDFPCDKAVLHEKQQQLGYILQSRNEETESRRRSQKLRMEAQQRETKEAVMLHQQRARMAAKYNVSAETWKGRVDLERERQLRDGREQEARLQALHVQLHNAKCLETLQEAMDLSMGESQQTSVDRLREQTRWTLGAHISDSELCRLERDTDLRVVNTIRQLGGADAETPEKCSGSTSPCICTEEQLMETQANPTEPVPEASIHRRSCDTASPAVPVTEEHGGSQADKKSFSSHAVSTDKPIASAPRTLTRTSPTVPSPLLYDNLLGPAHSSVAPETASYQRPICVGSTALISRAAPHSATASVGGQSSAGTVLQYPQTDDYYSAMLHPGKV